MLQSFFFRRSERNTGQCEQSFISYIDDGQQVPRVSHSVSRVERMHSACDGAAGHYNCSIRASAADRVALACHFSLLCPPSPSLTKSKSSLSRKPAIALGSFMRVPKWPARAKCLDKLTLRVERADMVGQHRLLASWQAPCCQNHLFGDKQTNWRY